ncbi:MAG: beta-ketoacyl-ACP reductase [Rhizobacter sp.]|nr:beta-ketoacyl-ACP reductase [Rhizobacter sp.]
MNLGIDGQVAIVTGGGRGIGAEISVALAEEGVRVVVWDRDIEPAQEVAGRIEAAGGRALAIAGDVRSSSDAKRVVAAAIEAFGGLHILVNNAGYTRNHPFAEMTEALWDEVIDVCLNGVFRVTHAAMPTMVAQGYGRVISIASRAATGTLNGTNYSAAKAGVIGFSKALAMEVGRSGVTVNTVSPGLVRTERVMKHAYFEELDAKWRATSLIPRGGEPRDIATAVLFLASVHSGFVTAENVCVTGGLP